MVEQSQLVCRILDAAHIIRTDACLVQLYKAASRIEQTGLRGRRQLHRAVGVALDAEAVGRLEIAAHRVDGHLHFARIVLGKVAAGHQHGRAHVRILAAGGKEQTEQYVAYVSHHSPVPPPSMVCMWPSAS